MQISKNFQVYKSSAGSGKTFTLARKYLNVILSHKDPNYFKRILAITFTVKAAHEMKERILAYLSGFAGNKTDRSDIQAMINLLEDDLQISQEEISARSNRILNRLVQHYGEFSVMTIDKFVHGLVRLFSSDLGLTSNFEVEIDQQQITERVSAELFSRVGDEKDITEIILAYVKHQTTRDKSWNVSGSIENLIYQLTDEDFFLNARNFETLDWESTSDILNWIDQRVEQCKNQVIEIGNTAINQAENLGLTNSDFYFGKTGIFGYFSKAKEGNLEYVWSPNSRVVATIEENKWASKSAPDHVLGIVEAWQSQYHKIEQIHVEIGNCLLLINLKSQVFRMALIGYLRQILQSVKEEDNQQLLSDFYQILSENFSEEATPFIYERIGQRFQHIMIDEFQDTSKLQWLNLIPLVENALAEGNSTLIVGDAKQSIYRFRGSEPQQFVELPTVARESQLLFTSEYESHVLEFNYRSAPSIIKFNNRFFKDLVNALPQSLASTYKDVAQKHIKKDGGSVRFDLVDTSQSDDALLDFFNAIESRLNQMTRIEKIPINDICILFRTNKEASFIASKLIEAGYPVASDESLLLENNKDVMLLILTLRCVDDPLNHFLVQKWIAYAKHSKKINQELHTLALSCYRDKWSFTKLLTQLGLYLPDRHEISNSFEFLHSTAIAFGLNTQSSFIQKLLDHALEYEQSNIKYKQSFTEYWQTTASKLSIDSPTGVNAIRIMTIHKSKGLEFPSVIVCIPELKSKNLTKEYTWIENTLNVPHLEHLYLKVSSLQNTPFESYYQVEADKSLLDEINTLYVAFTRAVKSLDIFMKQKKPSKGAKSTSMPQSKELGFVTNWPEWDSQSASMTL